MEIRFNIKGEGNVVVEGNLVKGQSVTLKATPVEPMLFGYYLIDGRKITTPIYVYYIKEDKDLDVEVRFYLTMEEYLKALFEYDVKKSTYMVAATTNGFSLYDDEASVSQEQKDLAQSDILYAICTSPSTIQGYTKRVGDWQETAESRGLTATDKKDMRNLADSLRSKWNKRKTIVTATITRW